MNCPGDDRCAIQEHKGYATCRVAGACQNHPIPRTPVRGRSAPEQRPTLADWCLGIAFFPVLALICAWLGD